VIKGKFIELVQEMIHADPTVETVVHDDVIGTFLGPVINYLLYKQYYIDLKDGETLIGLNGAFAYPFEAEPDYDETRKKWYIDMPYAPIVLTKDRGILYLGPSVAEENEYIPTSQTNQPILSTHYMSLTNRVFYRREGMKRIWFLNMDETNKCKVLGRIVVNADDLGEDDYLPIPSGLEMEAMGMLRDFLLGKRQLPEDNRVNDSDKS